MTVETQWRCAFIPNDKWVSSKQPENMREGAIETRELITRSQAEELLAAEIELKQHWKDEAERFRIEFEKAAYDGLLTKARAEKAEADNAALAARVKADELKILKLEERLSAEQASHEQSGKSRDEWRGKAEALEAKLAAAVEAHKSLFGDKTMEGILWPDVKPTDLITIRVQKQIYDKARAVLGGKPS
ncbi:hypothetical protein OHAE_315 [Ochrobactrum soli]|uniref:Phage protein n=1 Tax=Ochrobactrum soli TaxID=2448455 RepID=A0A2P9HK28_9HYPH|nr:hypothetical protein OHAE_315 [[Ochrobactrum] soli]